MGSFAPIIASKLNIKVSQVQAVLDLFSEAATIPFIARYRKDKTGGLDEVQIQHIEEESKFLKTFTERKEFIVKAIAEQGKMTEELQKKLDNVTTLTALEDIYIPYKPKRKTKAQTAKENGLEPLATTMLAQGKEDVDQIALQFLNEKITTTDEALAGARDIISELINEHDVVRAKMRLLFEQTACIQTKVLVDKETEGIKYKDYFDFSEPIHKIPSHRTMAILRGFLEGILRMSIAPIEEEAIALIEALYVKDMNPWREHLKKAVKDAYRRLLQPSLETEYRTSLKQKADEEAIHVFAENLRQLLLSAPLGSKKILAIDPGYRTGCKVVCLDEKGMLQQTELIFIHENNRLDQSEKIIRSLVKSYGVEAFAIGDGTAGRETEIFIQKLQIGLPIYLVNEDGASVYSASETAREEFPDKDITVRGSVSIGRRLMDPLAELVKIDPKSLGVGQYQHDVNQYRLKERLDQTVISCVNQVGVNINTASKHLLKYVSGITGPVAENIINYRTEIDGFTSRDQLKKVPRLGDKAYEQCAGFLRIVEAENPLDSSAVHPEAYSIVADIAKDANIAISDLIGNTSVIGSVDVKKYISETFGAHTINDILNELKKPGLDPRKEIEQFSFANIYKIEDVQVGMVVPGQVTNITRFGAFVDIGVKQDGLVHVSEIAHQYITDPSEFLKLGQKIQVKVTEIDIARKRIALSIKQTSDTPSKQASLSGNKKPEYVKPALGSDLSTLSVGDALQALKKRFGK
jgi:uncharacterized protein